MGLTFDDIINRIQEEKGVSREDILERVKQKLNKLSGLISNEGAVHIVANELGVDLISSIKRTGLKISRITPGMRNVTLYAKTLATYGVRTFTRENKPGKVGTLLVGDETGKLRVVLWDTNLIQHLEDGSITEGTILKIAGGNVKLNNGFKEIHLGNTSELTLHPEGVSITVPASSPSQRSYPVKTITEIHDGDFVSISGVVVQVFEPRFYQSCPECNKKVENACAVHGTVVAKTVPILNFYLDDGTGSIRVVAFREHGCNLLNVSEETLLSTKDNPAAFEPLKKAILGNQVVVTGKISHNTFSNQYELTVTESFPIQPEHLVNTYFQRS